MWKPWVRLGVSLYLKDEEVEPIMEGDAETLREVLRDGRGVPDGDSYVPSVTVEKFNKEYGTEYDDGEADRTIGDVLLRHNPNNIGTYAGITVLLEGRTPDGGGRAQENIVAENCVE